jgi:hypothetical protein
MSDWDAAPGIDPERVAEVLVTPASPGPERRRRPARSGSGGSASATR